MKTISFIERKQPNNIEVNGHKYTWNGVKCNFLMENYNLYLLIDNQIEIPAESPLTEKEKAYLKAVIEPFKEKIISIYKDSYRDDDNIWEYIEIQLENEFINLPVFEKNKYYKGLKTDKQYTLEELNLD